MAEEERQWDFLLKPGPSDLMLHDMLGERRYELLDRVVREEVTKTYRSEMLDACKGLLENEKLVGRIVPSEDREVEEEVSIREEDWFQDPSDMSCFQLNQAINQLSILVDAQKKANAKLRDRVEIVELAKNGLKMDVGLKLVELMTEEQKKTMD